MEPRDQVVPGGAHGSPGMLVDLLLRGCDGDGERIQLICADQVRLGGQRRISQGQRAELRAPRMEIVWEWSTAWESGN